MRRARSLAEWARTQGNTARLSLVLVVLAITVTWGSWTLLSDGEPQPAKTVAGDPGGGAQPATRDFHYADTDDRVLFQVDRTAATAVVAANAPTRDDASVPIRISRQAALASARRGTMDVELPDGTRYPVRYERSESAPGGNWTFIGRVDTAVGDLAAVITFGKDGVFGLLPTPDGTMMQVSTRAGQAYLKPAGGIVPPGVDPARHRDFVVPPKPASIVGPPMHLSARPAQGGGAPRPGAVRQAPAPISQAADEDGGEVPIDLLAAYTTNLVALRGTAAAVETEYQNLVAVTNQAHVDSGSRARFAIADFVELDFPADDWNEDALYAMTDNYLPDGTNIHELRDAAAADLVTLIRPYTEGDPSCGIAWIGGSRLGGYSMSDRNGYSVTAVEDCGPLVLAHEIGHNLGLMHDRETVTEQRGGKLGYGAFPFSFGYRQDGPPAFATVMAYDVRNQAWINRFSHPGTLLCEGVACGTMDEADNVRSINLTAGTTSRFRDPHGTITVLDGWVLEPDDSYRHLEFVVRLASPAPAGGVTFDLVVESLTATLGVDAESTLDDLTGLMIDEGWTSTSVALRILPDNAIEPAETIGVRLTNVQGAAVYDGDAVMTIVDDDATVPLEGRLRFPPGSRLPAEEVSVYLDQVVAGTGGDMVASARPPDFSYRFDVARGASVMLEAAIPYPYRGIGIVIERVDEPMKDIDLALVEPVRLSGEVQLPHDGLFFNAPVILWNPLGDGGGWYVNFQDWGYYGPSYGMWVFPGVPMQLELADPPSPYVRQLVEVPPSKVDATWNIELREEPSLTIGHVLVDEGNASDGTTSAAMTAELSVPAAAGGVTFDVEVAGTAEAEDFHASVGTFSIAEGETTTEFAVTIIGDDRGEPDEIVELRITNIRGAAWNPGPGSVRIVNDDAYPVASDFNGDGVSDVLWRNGESGANAIWRAADYDRQMPITGVTNLDWQIVGTGDFDGDGISGVVWRNRVTGANVIWRSARFADPIRVASVGNTDWEIVSVADFNGNGKSDLLWRNKSTHVITIWESARHEGQGPTGAETGPEWRVAGTGDFDGDGRDDILWRSIKSGANVIWGGGSVIHRYRIAHAGLDWDVAGIGDFDGDDRDDIAWRSRVSGGNALWPAADGARARALYGVESQAWDVEAVGDYDGDGVADLFWRNAETGTNVIWHGASATNATRPTTVRNMAWQVRP